MNKKGEVALILIGVIALIGTIGASNAGKFKKAGFLQYKKIGCKIMNKGNDFCDAKYE